MSNKYLSDIDDSFKKRLFSIKKSTPIPAKDLKLLKSEPWINDVKSQKVYVEGWRCSLIFVLEADPSFHGAVQLINHALEYDKRKAVRIITRKTIEKLALDCCFKTGKRTPFSALCEAVRLAGNPSNIYTILKFHIVCKYLHS